MQELLPGNARVYLDFSWSGPTFSGNSPKMKRVEIRFKGDDIALEVCLRTLPSLDQSVRLPFRGSGHNIGPIIDLLGISSDKITQIYLNVVALRNPVLIQSNHPDDIKDFPFFTQTTKRILVKLPEVIQPGSGYTLHVSSDGLVCEAEICRREASLQISTEKIAPAQDIDPVLQEDFNADVQFLTKILNGLFSRMFDYIQAEAGQRQSFRADILEAAMQMAFETVREIREQEVTEEMEKTPFTSVDDASLMYINRKRKVRTMPFFIEFQLNRVSPSCLRSLMMTYKTEMSTDGKIEFYQKVFSLIGDEGIKEICREFLRSFITPPRIPTAEQKRVINELSEEFFHLVTGNLFENAHFL